MAEPYNLRAKGGLFVLKGPKSATYSEIFSRIRFWASYTNHPALT